MRSSSASSSASDSICAIRLPRSSYDGDELARDLVGTLDGFVTGGLELLVASRQLLDLRLRRLVALHELVDAPIDLGRLVAAEDLSELLM